MKLYYCILFFLATALRAEVGCMDNSQHGDTSHGYDYKKYHYVRCNCPCNRYAWSQKRGRCERCLHFRRPTEINYINRD